MRKLRFGLFVLLLASLPAVVVFASANFVYHERSGNSVSGSTSTNGACPSGGIDASHPQYVEVLSPTSVQPEYIRFKVECQFFTDSLAVLYTTGTGSCGATTAPSPTGTFTTSGADQVLVPTGSTQIVRFVGTRPDLQVGNISYSCTFNDPLTPCGPGTPVDIVTAVIPPQPAGTVVQYVVAAWHHGGGNITFADSGNCGSCFNCNDPSCAAQFCYQVISPTAADGSIKGRITNSVGAPLGGVTISLSGAQSNRAVTDSNGKYSFDEVATEGFYTVTPELANYSFFPANRSFSLAGQQAEAGFTAEPAAMQIANPLDTPEYFVRQQYLDFLNREPDNDGLKYWAEQIRRCGEDEVCAQQRRTAVSAAFFMSKEYQDTGSYVYGLYKAGLGRLLSYDEYRMDRNQLIGGATLDAQKAKLTADFINRQEFLFLYPQGMSGADFVDALLRTVRTSSGVDLSGQRAAFIEAYNNAGGRVAVLRQLIESQAFSRAEYNRAFVVSEYFSYLKRNPELPGLDFWLNIFSNHLTANNYQAMVCAFVTSKEYQLRFSSVVTHSNAECSR